MKDFLLSNGFWFYKDCGCRIPGKIYKNHSGLEIKLTQRTGEFTITRAGQVQEQGLMSHYMEKLKPFL